MKVWCYYHRSDLDGHCCCEIVRMWCEVNRHEFVPRGVDYGDTVDWMEGAGEDAMAVIADFAPDGDDPARVMGVMDRAYGGGCVWIDHHKTAIERAGERGEAVRGIRRDGTAACRLAWDFFFKGEQEPDAVRLLGLYDVFDRSDRDAWDYEILPFQYGMRIRETLPDGRDDKHLWRRLFSRGDMWRHMVENITNDGMVALRAERESNRKTALAAAYDCYLGGLLCCAVNARGNSLVLDAYARPEHKMRVLWEFTGGRWRVSLYENGHDEVDCGQIAQMHGGGGHRGAAGFSLPPDLCPLVFFEPVGKEERNERSKRR